MVGGSRLPTMADRASMPYTNAVIHETQRMGNIVPLGLPHMATRDTTLGGYSIPQVLGRPRTWWVDFWVDFVGLLRTPVRYNSIQSVTHDISWGEQWVLKVQPGSDHLNFGYIHVIEARQVYLYSTFHTQTQFKVLYIELKRRAHGKKEIKIRF